MCRAILDYDYYVLPHDSLCRECLLRREANGVVKCVLRVGSVCGAFGTNAVGRGHTLGKIGLGLGPKSFMAVVKNGNTNGSAALGTVTNM